MWSIVKWPVIPVLVIVMVALLYWATPNVQQPRFRWLSVGAVIAITVAIVASIGFGFYVSGFSNYDKTYGPLAGVIVFLLWMWLMNLALLFGAEVDAEPRARPRACRPEWPPRRPSSSRPGTRRPRRRRPRAGPAFIDEQEAIREETDHAGSERH